MKKIIFLIFILGGFYAVKAQDNKISSPALQEAKKLNAQVVTLYQQGKFEEAVPVARKVVQIRETELGKDHIETAKALANLGFVYSSINNQKEAGKNLEIALEIFDKQTSATKQDNLLIADVAERLAFIKYNFEKPQAAENLFEKALFAYEKAGEKDSLKAGKILFSLASLQSAKKDYAKSSNLFEQVLAIRIKRLGEKHSDTIDAFDNSACVLRKDDREKEIKRIQEAYFPSAELTENGNLKWAQDKIEKDLNVVEKTVESGVINGKALSMPIPAYPVEARHAKANGTVKVRVKINEQGNVVYACGAFNNVHKALIEASEAAAYSAKFSPTLLKDKAVKVTGNIVYNFIAPQ